MQNSFKRKKKKIESIFYENAPGSDESRISTRIKCRRVCMKTFGWHIQWTKKKMQNSLERKEKKNLSILYENAPG